MEIDNLSGLPPWDDNEFDDDNNEGEVWKFGPTKAACKALYLQWAMVMTVLKATFDSLHEADEAAMLSREMMEDHVKMIMNDAYEIAVKIKSSEAGLYTIRMENASIIRKNAQFIKISTNSFLLDGLMEPQNRQIIRDEIEKFKELFKVWVKSFQKDEFEDEWGLFI